MVLKVLDHLEEWIISFLMAAATIIIFVAVVHRYASGYELLFPYASQLDFSWAQELCIYMFVWMAKFGAAYGVRTGIHVGVDVLVNRLPAAKARRVILFGLLCGALFTGVVGTLGGIFVWHMSETGQQSNDLEAPMWIVYLAVPLGSYLMCFRFLQVAWHFFRTGDLPHHEAAHVEGVEAPEPVEPVPIFPALLVGICFLAKFGLIEVGPGTRSLLIFALLIALMMTGMPISIALGLTVLTFLFTLTQVPIEAVALKLFTGIERFEFLREPVAGQPHLNPDKLPAPNCLVIKDNHAEICARRGRYPSPEWYGRNGCRLAG